MECFDSEKGLSTDCFETILQTIAEGIFIIDPSGIIRFCNRGLEIMSGYPASSMTGKRCHDIMVCACSSMNECRLLAGDQVNNFECQLKKADGIRLAVLKNGRPIKAPDGSIIGAVETITDISALKQIQRKNAALEKEAKRSDGRFNLLIGKSKPMQDVFDLIELAAASNVSVLITGETGTGKELTARTIHQQSSRKAGPLIKVNCSALTESLLESELFGHAKGAFTGAIKDKIGRFEMADGGTLFLDEIGDVSPFIQVKLLRFLQEREFERVGEGETRKADVRIITATNKDLRDLVKKGEFREDLYYRLKVFPIHMPPLRERKEDVGLLINFFLEKFNRQTGKSIIGLSSEAALTVMDFFWPGNIRELENAIEHAFVTCREKEIGIFDLPLEIRHVELITSLGSRDTGKLLQGTAPFEKRKHLTKEDIDAALKASHGNRLNAAKLLGVDRTTLWRHSKKF
jgi:two-component system response regulator HydG